MKHVFSVPDMSCNHCRMRIEKALDASGKAKAWTVDLPGKTVAVESDSDVAAWPAFCRRRATRPLAYSLPERGAVRAGPAAGPDR
jgi:copper chaperone